MQQVTRKILIILVLLQFFTFSWLGAQTLTYELVGNYTSMENTVENPDTLVFTNTLPEGFKFCRYEFSVAPIETVTSGSVFIFTPPTGWFTTTLYYTTTAGDCSNTDPNLSSKPFQVTPKLAHFTVGYDRELLNLASLKRVFRSSLSIPNNLVSEIGNNRFYWNFDAKMIPAPAVDFDPNDPALGQYPNVYYTFPNGGNYQISLSVADVTAPDATALFTRSLDLNPEFTTTKLDFPNIPNILVPTSATNNLFKVPTSGTSLLAFKVFSRTGSLVYQYEGNVISWDGKNYNGQDLPEGIYYFLLEDVSNPVSERKYNPAKGFFYIYR